MSNYKQQKIPVSNLIGYTGKKGSYIDLRSGYEIKAVKMLQQLVKLKKISGWSSEESVFQYIYELDNKPHRYFMDFTVEVDGKVIFVEVKPLTETQPPRKKKTFKTAKQRANYENQIATYIKNQNKWKAVRDWCTEQNSKMDYKKYSFAIWTEKELSIK